MDINTETAFILSKRHRSLSKFLERLAVYVKQLNFYETVKNQLTTRNIE